MSQDQSVIHLDTSVGYLLKQAATSLRSSMEATLRPLGMNVTHYSCLELLGQRPGLSNSELARRTFVTRQSMNTLLQSLEKDGYVIRAKTPSSGRILPTIITAKGQSQLLQASQLIKQVEDRMLAALSETSQDELREALKVCIHSLS